MIVFVLTGVVDYEGEDILGVFQTFSEGEAAARQHRVRDQERMKRGASCFHDGYKIYRQELGALVEHDEFNEGTLLDLVDV